MHSTFKQVIVVAALLVGVGSSASAEQIDLTTAGADGELNGALFFQVDPQSTGTGVIDPFVQVGGNDAVVDAYNTTVNDTLDNGGADNFNHELLYTAIPIVTIDGVDYLEFILDINQNNSAGGGNFYTLDEVQIFQSATANQSVESFTGCTVNLVGDLVYSMDDGCTETNSVLFDYALNNGSGSGDMLMYIPEDLFDPTIEFVYLYSKFGESFDNNDGFEEWGLREGGSGGDGQTPIPEPASLVLLGSGLAFAAKRLRTKKKI